MGIFDGIMILSDLDGTLLNHAELSPQHLEAVRYFVDNGGAFCPATGRAEDFLFKNFPDLPLKNYCIVKNGTAIYDCHAKNYIWYKSFDSGVWDRLSYILERFADVKKVSVHAMEEFVSFDEGEALSEKIKQAVRGEALKIVLHIPKAHDLVEHCEQFGDYQYVCSTENLFEILPKETGKGVSVNVLRTLLKDIKCFVGIGDYENDVSLLEAADIAVAVDGGFEPLKAYADWVAPPVEEHPIAWLIEKLEQEIRAGRIS